MDILSSIPVVLAYLWPLLQTVILAGIAFLIGKALHFLFKKTDLLNEEKEAILESKVIDAIQIGISETMDTYVKAIKEGRADGKLTKEEAAEARRRALKIAVEILKEKGVDLFKFLKEPILEYLVNYLVEVFKMPKNE